VVEEEAHVGDDVESLPSQKMDKNDPISSTSYQVLLVATFKLCFPLLVGHTVVIDVL